MSSTSPNDEGRARPARRTPRHATPADPTDPSTSPEFLSTFAVLVHELRNLADGSLRCLSLARRSLCASDAWAKDPAAERVQRQLDAATTALEQMAGLAHAALQGPALPLGSPLLAAARPVSLGEAIEHAAEVVRPLADDLGVSLSTSVTEPAAECPAGPLYLPILNGLRNALESIERLGLPDHRPGGAVHLQARTEGFDIRTATKRDMIAIEITDDGVGPPQGPDIARVFDHGFSTKPGGQGLGLAIAKAVVEKAGGTISLLRRRDPRDPTRPGALFRIVFPLNPAEGQ